MQIQYDSRGRPASVTQGARVYGYAYDSLGNLASLTDPLARTVSFAYDLAGRPTRQLISRPSGDSIVPSYDSAGRLSSLQTSAGTTSYGYSPTTGQLLQITAPDLGKLSYAYDGALLTGTSWSGSVSGSIQRSYDNFFRLASESVSGGQSVSFQYDADGLLTSAGALRSSAIRAPASSPAARSALSPTRTATTLTARRPATLPRSRAATCTPSATRAMRWGGSRARRSASAASLRTPSATGTISPEGSRTCPKDGTPTAHYAYDANGNRLAGPGLTSSPAYDAQDRLLSYGNATYTYKASGELLTKTDTTGTTSYDYDALGNLRHVTLPNGRGSTTDLDPVWWTPEEASKGSPWTQTRRNRSGSGGSSRLSSRPGRPE